MDSIQVLGIREIISPLLITFIKFNPAALAFTLFLWVPYARFMNASVMPLKRVEFVQAEKVSVVKNFHVMLRHLT